MNELNPEKALIFRITHIENVSWILKNGLHCYNSQCRDPVFRQIGNPDLIDKRANRLVPLAPCGTLSDYVAFYFTPYSPMLLNIKTGYNGVPVTPMPKIVILVSSLHQALQHGLDFVFSDRHAYMATAQFFKRLEDLSKIDWKILQKRDFKRNPDDPGKFERYQAEALIHRVMPVSALLGIACHGTEQEKEIGKEVNRLSLSTKVIARPGWYF